MEFSSKLPVKSMTYIFFVRTENITSVQLTAFGNCSRVQIFVGVGVGFFTIQFAFSQLKQCLPDDSLSKITK